MILTAFVFGFVFGLFYFGALWRQVARWSERPPAGARVMVGTFARLVAAMAMFAAVATLGFGPLVAMTVGFLGSRILLLQWVMSDRGGAA